MLGIDLLTKRRYHFLLLKIALIVFMAEGAIMSALMLLPLPISPTAHIIADVLLLALFTTPLILIFAVRPYVDQSRRTTDALFKSEKSLYKSEEKFRAIVENLHDIVAVIAPDGTFLYHNTPMMDNLGYSDGELVGKNGLKLVHPMDLTRITKVLYGLVTKPHDVINAELRFRHKNGSWRTLSAFGKNAMSKSGINGIVVNARDVTDTKRSEKVLRTIVEGTSASTGVDFFHHLTKSLSEGLGVDYAFVGGLPSDAPGHVRTTAVWAKGEAGENIEYELTGTPCENVVGKEICCFSDHVQQLFPTDHLLVEMGVESYAGAPIFARDGTPLGLLVALHSEPMQNTELVKSMLTIFSARAGAELERQRAEVQLIQSSKLATLGEMATGIAHELNQPLNIIHMAAESMQELAKEGDLLPEMQAGKLDRILDQTDRASAIINHMRMFGRIESGKLENVDLTESVQGAAGLLKEQLRLSEIGLSVDLPETYRNVMGQQLQLEQVILNLLTNARDAIKGNEDSGKNPQRITISITDDPGSGEVSLSVQDTGGGIPDTILDSIFEPFFTTKEVGEGTGLGLSISYSIITGMGGRIEVANVNGGAKFTIALSAAPET